MTSKTRKTVLWSVAILALIVSFHAVYLAGYRSGGRDALEWDFAACIGGKMVPVGRGTALLRSRVELRPTGNINMVSSVSVKPPSSRERGVQPTD